MILELLVAATAGALVGCATGLLPGLHVNTLSVLLVAAAPAAIAAAPAVGVAPEAAPLVLGAAILAITVSHTFVNVVPGTFLGAPDETTALSILPSHRLLLRGQGYRAVALNAYGSFFALALSLVLFVPLHWLLAGPPQVWDWIRGSLLPLLVLLVAFLVWREPAELGPRTMSPAARRHFARLAALALFLAAGVYGLVSFRLRYDALLPFPPSPLLPMLGGLFGAATLLEALAQPSRLPHQFLRLQEGSLDPVGAGAALGAGVVAGAGMSLLPGLTNATATAAATALRQGNDEETLVTLGAVNTANAVFNLLVLQAFGQARSGAVVALAGLVPLDPWRGPMPAQLLWFLFVALAAGLWSLAATLALGRWAARRVHRVPYHPLVRGVLVYVALVVVLFTGWTGAAVFVVGAALGLLTVRVGLQRTHLTGVLLVAVIGHLAF